MEITLIETSDFPVRLYAKSESYCVYLGDLAKGFTSILKNRIRGAEEKLLEQKSLDSYSLNKVFKPNGRLRNVVIVNNSFKLKLGTKSKTLKIRHETKEADISYLCLRLCLYYNICENSVDALIIKHALRTMI
jgi:hypothetical protein